MNGLSSNITSWELPAGTLLRNVYGSMPFFLRLRVRSRS